MKLFPSGREPTHFEQRSLSSNSTPLLPPPRVIMRGVNHSCILTHFSTFESVIYADRREGAQGSNVTHKVAGSPAVPAPVRTIGPRGKGETSYIHIAVDVKGHLAKSPRIFRISSCIQIWQRLRKVSSRNLSGQDPPPCPPAFVPNISCNYSREILPKALKLVSLLRR